MWHKAIWKGHQMKLELTHVGLLVELANNYITKGALKDVVIFWIEKVASERYYVFTPHHATQAGVPSIIFENLFYHITDSNLLEY